MRYSRFFCFALLALVFSPKIVLAETTWEWTTPTPGATNISATVEPVYQDTVGQQVPLSALTLVINEIFAKGSATDAEFVEVYNYGTVPVEASGLIIENKSGKKFVLPEGSVIASKDYFVVQGQLPITDAGDHVTLYRGAEVVDTMAYASDLKEGFASGRYCDVYELRFCEERASVPTPGVMNVEKVLEVWAEPADGVLRPGQKAVLRSNFSDARIVVSPLPSLADAKDSFLYEQPLEIQESMTYWFYAQQGAQATVPKKITFRVDSSAPSESLVQAARGVKISEVFLEPETKRGWVELHHTGTVPVLLQQFRIDTRATRDADCSRCAQFSGTHRLYGGGYTVLELPKATVSTLLQRQSVIDVRLVLGAEVLDTFALSMLDRPEGIGSWVSESSSVSWSDIPTPGAKNVLLDLTSMSEFSPYVLAKALYADAAYADDTLLLRGRGVPGATVIAFAQGVSVGTSTVDTQGGWLMKVPSSKLSGVIHLTFRQTTSQGMVGLMSAPFAIPAFDMADPRQDAATVTAKADKVSIKAQSTVAPQLRSSAPTTSAFETIPFLSSMSGVTLTEIATGYKTETPRLAALPERTTSVDPLSSWLFGAVRVFATLLTPAE